MRGVVVAMALTVMLAGCETGTAPGEPSRTVIPRDPPSSLRSVDPAEPGTVPPVWLGKHPLRRAANGLGEIQPTPPELLNRRFTLRDRLPPLPGSGFASRIDPVPEEVLARSSWTPECPVDAEDLRWVRLAFWGFDGRRHTGELLVNADAAEALVQVFDRLFAARFPLEEMRITRAEELDAEPTGDGNNTGAFTCRPLHGSTTWAQHAHGLAVDVNPFQNPYIKPPGAIGVAGDMLIPELAAAYLDRSRQEPGMIRPDDAVVRAFASVGWQWGGNWQKAKDYMHFSANGR